MIYLKLIIDKLVIKEKVETKISFSVYYLYLVKPKHRSNLSHFSRYSKHPDCKKSDGLGETKTRETSKVDLFVFFGSVSSRGKNSQRKKYLTYKNLRETLEKKIKF